MGFLDRLRRKKKDDEPKENHPTDKSSAEPKREPEKKIQDDDATFIAETRKELAKAKGEAHRQRSHRPKVRQVVKSVKEKAESVKTDAAVAGITARQKMREASREYDDMFDVDAALGLRPAATSMIVRSKPIVINAGGKRIVIRDNPSEVAPEVPRRSESDIIISSILGDQAGGFGDQRIGRREREDDYSDLVPSIDSVYSGLGFPSGKRIGKSPRRQLHNTAFGTDAFDLGGMSMAGDMQRMMKEFTMPQGFASSRRAKREPDFFKSFLDSNYGSRREKMDLGPMFKNSGSRKHRARNMFDMDLSLPNLLK